MVLELAIDTDADAMSKFTLVTGGAGAYEVDGPPMVADVGYPAKWLGSSVYFGRMPGKTMKVLAGSWVGSEALMTAVFEVLT